MCAPLLSPCLHGLQGNWVQQIQEFGWTGHEQILVQGHAPRFLDEAREPRINSTHKHKLNQPRVSFLLIFAVGVEWGEPGENRGGSGGEPGAPKRTGGEPGAFGKRTGGEPGAFGIHLQRVPGEKRGLWDKNRGRTGGGNFL